MSLSTVNKIFKYLYTGVSSIFLRKEIRSVTLLRSKYSGIQLEIPELLAIKKAIENFPTCRLLVFGLGNDSPFWLEVNRNGRTVFLENNRPWFDKLTRKYPKIEAYLIEYPCNILQWEEVLDKPERLSINLPLTFIDAKWDVILVDGPYGFEMTSEQPGRMSSIYMASRMVAKGGYVFVHDAERTVEAAYCERYLNNKNLIGAIIGRAQLNQYYYPVA